MNTAIIDDDSMLAQLMHFTLNKYAAEHNYEISTSIFDSGEAFLQNFIPNKYDIVFMDIYMEGMSGVRTARRMRALDNEVILIFLTSSDEHMPDAFSCHAFDYLLKPAKPERVYRVMDDCLEIISKRTSSNNRYIEFSENHREVRVYLRDLVSLEVNNHYVYITTVDGTEYHPKQSFSSLTKDITEENFLLINRGVMVNMDYVANISDGECILKNKSSFPVKIREKNAIQKQWMDYTFRKKSSL